MAAIRYIVLLLLSSTLKAGCLQITLQQALDRKLVEVNVTSLGGYQGFCMRMDVKNLWKDSLYVTVEPGRRLKPADAGNQDILVVKEELLRLKSREEKSAVLKGYCCEATDLSPARNAKYHVNKLADSSLVALAEFLNAHTFNQEAEQEAVWAISNNRSLANICAVNDSSVHQLREKAAAIKGEKLPWYMLVSKKHLYQNGVIAIINLRLHAAILYSESSQNYATLKVINASGVEVCAIKSEWLQAGINKTYMLELPVKHLEKGKYTVMLQTVSREIFRNEFEL